MKKTHYIYCTYHIQHTADQQHREATQQPEGWHRLSTYRNEVKLLGTHDKHNMHARIHVYAFYDASCVSFKIMHIVRSSIVLSPSPKSYHHRFAFYCLACSCCPPMSSLQRFVKHINKNLWKCRNRHGSLPLRSISLSSHLLQSMRGSQLHPKSALFGVPQSSPSLISSRFFHYKPTRKAKGQGLNLHMSNRAKKGYHTN